MEHESGFTLFVPEGLEGTVDVVEPHDQLILRLPGDPERSSRTTALTCEGVNVRRIHLPP